MNDRSTLIVHDCNVVKNRNGQVVPSGATHCDPGVDCNANCCVAPGVQNGTYVYLSGRLTERRRFSAFLPHLESGSCDTEPGGPREVRSPSNPVEQDNILSRILGCPKPACLVPHFARGQHDRTDTLRTRRYSHRKRGASYHDFSQISNRCDLRSCGLNGHRCKLRQTKDNGC